MCEQSSRLKRLMIDYDTITNANRLETNQVEEEISGGDFEGKTDSN